MLAIQIAAGIVLAVVVLRFWRQSLWIAGGLVVLFLIVVAVLWLMNSPQGQDVLPIAGAVLGAGLLRFWSQRSQHPIARWVYRETHKTKGR